MVPIGPLADPRLEQIAYDIFSFKYPIREYDSNFRQGERTECRQIALKMAMTLKYGHQQANAGWAIPSGQGIDERWREEFVKSNMGNALSALAASVPFTSLDVEDRTWIREQCESLVDEAVARFAGPIDTGSQYLPELDRESQS